MKIVMGLVWFAVIYFFACVILGGIAGGIAGANNPQNAAAAGAEAGARIVGTYRPLIALGAAVIAGAGSMFGILPGTATKPDASNSDNESNG